MSTQYPFLHDELALQEIRKHKWIESQKKGQEIGFATAALDWIKRHGENFRNFRADQSNAQNKFQEKRTYRRFEVSLPLIIKCNNHFFTSTTKDINIIGFSCITKEDLPINSDVEVTINFSAIKETKNPENHLTFKNRIKRVADRAGTQQKEHELFIPFSENIRDYFRANFISN